MHPLCRTAFKEWAAVCAALSAGRQTVILRKGGIAEGPGGFQPEHGEFWLLPTRFTSGQSAWPRRTGIFSTSRRLSCRPTIGCASPNTRSWLT